MDVSQTACGASVIRQVDGALNTPTGADPPIPIDLIVIGEVPMFCTVSIDCELCPRVVFWKIGVAVTASVPLAPIPFPLTGKFVVPVSGFVKRTSAPDKGPVATGKKMALIEHVAPGCRAAQSVGVAKSKFCAGRSNRNTWS